MHSLALETNGLSIKRGNVAEEFPLQLATVGVMNILLEDVMVETTQLLLSVLLLVRYGSGCHAVCFPI